MATVTGVYVTDPDGAPEDRTGLWTPADRRAADLAEPRGAHDTALPLLVADTDTYRALAAGIGEVTLVTWDVAPEADPPRIADLGQLSSPPMPCATS